MMIHRKAVRLSSLCIALCAIVAAGQGPTATLSPPDIFERVSPSVMVVESLDAKGSVTAFGSGVVICGGCGMGNPPQTLPPDSFESKRVVTNRHVIEGGVSFTVEHGGKTWPANVVRVDSNHDLAELSVGGLTAPFLLVRDSSTLAVGEKVYAIGAPEGLELTISEGLISGLRDFDKGRVIQTSAAISPGSSGGGLFDAEGRLVGITTFYLKEGQSQTSPCLLSGRWLSIASPLAPLPPVAKTAPLSRPLRGARSRTKPIRLADTTRESAPIRKPSGSSRTLQRRGLTWELSTTASGSTSKTSAQSRKPSG